VVRGAAVSRYGPFARQRDARALGGACPAGQGRTRSPSRLRSGALFLRRTPVVPGRATLCQLVPRCDRGDCTLNCTLADLESRTASKPRFLPRLRATRMVGRAGFEDSVRGCGRSCHAAPRSAHECHTSEVVASRGRRGCATECQAVPRCDHRHCTLHCTLAARGGRTSMRRRRRRALAVPRRNARRRRQPDQ